MDNIKRENDQRNPVEDYSHKPVINEYSKQLVSRIGRDDFIKSSVDWNNSKVKKQEELSSAQEARIQQSCPFKPQISKMSKKMMRAIGQKGVIQNVQVPDPGNFENRNEFYQERKEQRLQVIESEMMKKCSFTPTLYSREAKPSMQTQPIRRKKLSSTQQEIQPAMNHESVPDTNQTPYFSIGSQPPIEQNSVAIYSE